MRSHPKKWHLLMLDAAPRGDSLYTYPGNSQWCFQNVTLVIVQQKKSHKYKCMNPQIIENLFYIILLPWILLFICSPHVFRLTNDLSMGSGSSSLVRGPAQPPWCSKYRAERGVGQVRNRAGNWPSAKFSQSRGKPILNTISRNWSNFGTLIEIS